MPLVADVCVVGSGPAGLVAAAELLNKGLTVVVLESGGPSPNPDGRALSDGEVVGDPIRALDLVETRNRQVGGNANVWVVKVGQEDGDWVFGVRYSTFTEADLTVRPWIHNSGWPVTMAEMDPWIRRAHHEVAIGPYGYDLADRGANTPFTPFSSTDFDARYFNFGKRDRFIREMTDLVRHSPRARLISNATATGLTQPSSGRPVEAVRFHDETGMEGVIKARFVVLATGGVENARLLLASESQRGGVGNENDNVGRYFMDHPLFSIGDIHLTPGSSVSQASFFDMAPVEGSLAHGHVVTSASLAAKLELLQIGISLFPRAKARHNSALHSVKYLVQSPRTYLRSPGHLVRTIGRVAGGIDYLPRAVWMSKVRGKSVLPGYGRGEWSVDPAGMQFADFEVVFQCEQAPNRSSRVTLSDRRDAYGSPLPTVNWLLGDQTRGSVLQTQQLIAAQIAASGFGTYEPRTGNFSDLDVPASMSHHLGTTRMSTDPKLGVVDAQCRVHSAPNLFIAGSSVFSTSSYANPTLPIVAFSMRLAAQILKDSAGTASVGAVSLPPVSPPVSSERKTVAGRRSPTRRRRRPRLRNRRRGRSGTRHRLTAG